MEDFKSELTTLINKHSIDSILETPDFIIADHLIEYIEALRATLKARDIWRSDQEG